MTAKTSRRSFLIVTLLIFIFYTHLATTDELNDLDQQLQATKSQLDNAVNTKNSTQARLAELEKLKQKYQGSLSSIEKNYQLTRSQLEITQENLIAKEGEITNVENQIALTTTLINERFASIKHSIRVSYIELTPAWLRKIFAGNALSDLTNTFIYNRSITTSINSELSQLKSELITINEINVTLKELKKSLEEEQALLISQQRNLQNQINITQTSIQNAQSEIQSLSQSLVGIDQQINSLTQQQRNILAAKAAAALASTSVGDIEIDASAIEKSAPKDGQVYFSFWTYGYPHRVGMNQYGAFGRAKAGQNYDAIIKSYYQGIAISNWIGPTNITISTDAGNQAIAFEEDYLLGIGEMPSCWGAPDRGGLEALKAQAIAARTYAINYTQNGQNPICTTQACQVYVGASKVSGTCGEYWKQAVEETRGLVITYNGEPITAWYASTAGGFTLSAEEVWGGYRPYVLGMTDLDSNGNAYDGPVHGDSPWYKKAWGNEPWLSVTQVADLINAALLPESYNNQLASAQNGGMSGEQVVATLTSLGIAPVTNLQALTIVDQNGTEGRTPATAQVAKVRAYFGSGKMTEVTGSRFKLVFNLRSPGTNALWTTRFEITAAADL